MTKRRPASEQLGTAVAVLRAVRLDQNKFNDLVFDGHYTEAPKAGRGMPRRFTDPNAIIGVYCLARMLDLGLPGPIAATIASSIIRQMRKNDEDGGPTIARFIIAQDYTGFSILLSADDRDKVAGITGFCLVFDRLTVEREIDSGIKRVSVEIEAERQASVSSSTTKKRKADEPDAPPG